MQRLTTTTATTIPRRIQPTHPHHRLFNTFSRPRTHTVAASTHALRTRSQQPKHPALAIASAPRAAFTTTPYRNMSDADYEAFLNKANADSTEASANTTTKSSKAHATNSVNTTVPDALRSLDAVYVSEADEEFEGVALSLPSGDGSKELDADLLKSLLSHDGDVSELSIKEWDPRGAYKSVVSAVGGVVDGGEGGVKVFWVELGGARGEYFVVGLQEQKVVGVKALSVES